MAMPEVAILDARIKELDVKYLILRENIRSLNDELLLLERERAALASAREGLINATGVVESYAIPTSTRISDTVNGVVTTPGVRRSGVRLGSIKEGALRALAAAPEGLLAIDVLRAINEDRDPPLSRTSLSPQLSRLGQSGLAAQEKSVWKITPKGRLALAELTPTAPGGVFHR